jgi:hypothetical protein
MAMAEALQGISNLEVRATPHIWDITEDTVADIRQFAQRADLIISMPISNQYKPGLGTSELLSISRSSCQVVIHPNIHFEGAHPTFDYIRDAGGKHIQLHKLSNPFGDYFCYLLYVLWTRAVTVTDATNILRSTKHLDLVNGFFMHSLDNLQKREDQASLAYKDIRNHELLRISPLLAKDVFECGFFDTFNHPSSRFLNLVLSGLIQASHCGMAIESKAILDYDARPIIPQKLRLPVYKFVAESLLLEGCCSYGQSFVNTTGESESLECMVEKVYCFFSRLSADLIKCICNEPKLGLGEAYANLLTSS